MGDKKKFVCRVVQYCPRDVDFLYFRGFLTVRKSLKSNFARMIVKHVTFRVATAYSEF